MTRTDFHRPARTFPPSVPEQQVSLATPPQKPATGQAQNWLYLLMPLLSSVSMAAYMITFGRPWMIALGIAFVVVSVGVTFAVRWQTGKTSQRARHRQRKRYAAYLADIRRNARESASAQRAVAAFLHPSPDRLWAIAVSRRRVWERRPTDPDFLKLRLGLGHGTPAMRITRGTRSDPTAEFEPQSQRASEKLAGDYATVGLQPAWIDVAQAGVVSLLGPMKRSRSVAGALIGQLAVLHAPDDVQLAVLAEDTADWEWTKWLPHTHHSGGAPVGADYLPLVAGDIDGLADFLQQTLERVQSEQAERAASLLSRRDESPKRRLVVVLDNYRPQAAWSRLPLITDLLDAAGPAGGVHVICLVEQENAEPSRVDARARISASGGLTLESRTPALISNVQDAVADRGERDLCEQTARTLAPLRLSGERDQVLARTVSLADMLGYGDLAELDPTGFWRAPDDQNLLRVPVGVTGDGTELVLDLKEAAQGGIGPHGLVVGATGSGKSELLRTLVTGLTMTHSPEQLSFVLVDFKGGATFAGVTELPHVAGLITNLADDLALVDRMRAALIGEQQRRQTLLRAAGNVDSVREYQIRQAAGGTDVEGRPLEPMPYLMITVDEFGELLSQRPDFIDLFVQIGRVGRSLGMHLLLATQRLDEGRLRGLESHLSYRICLRTFSAAESRAVIGTPDAYRLPSIPGSAYLKGDEALYQRFRVAHISAPYEEPGSRQEEVALPVREPAPFAPRTAADARRAVEEPAQEETATPAPSAAGGRTEMQVAVERLCAYGRPVHQVWLPPLPPAVQLDWVLGPTAPHPERGYQATDFIAPGQLAFPVGVLDLPTRQEQRALLLDMAGGPGHVALVGAPQSGKSTALRTALLSAMLTHTPDELQFIGVDFGGGTLAAFEKAPHVSGVATRHDLARTRRVLSVARQLLIDREQIFQRLEIDSAAEFRRRRLEGQLPADLNAADVVLIVDNWSALRAAVEEADTIIQDISARGLGVGIHLLLTANRWGEIRISLRDNIAGRLELRLGEPGESEVSRPVARTLGAAVPGRGIAPPGSLFQVALPRMDGLDDTDGLTKAQDAVLTDIALHWSGRPAPGIRVLPERITAEDLDTAARTGAQDEPVASSAVTIGLRERDLAPMSIDLRAGEPHFLVLGDSGSGKTSFLRSWMLGMTLRQTAWDIRFLVVDYRRSLLDAVPEEYLAAQAYDLAQTTTYVSQVVDKLKERMPPLGVTARQLRERSWWSGPEFYVVVDDYDLVAGQGGRGPLTPLAEYLTQADDLGIHLVVARRTGGFSRSLMSDPLLGRLREFGTGGLILSGDPREGVLLANQRAEQRVPGRGVLVSRRDGADIIQVALDPDTPTDD
ncbi:type VII secretion protein EccCa [Streptomyces shenzhenensis]|uniref:type VII secretion protein EccCa n=1 Tax=Streptomyces shenzhenensis TaxID=943815 RepID=UPI00369EC73E